jgi:glycosyltransferase involved in cell wall biosynthesis
MLIDDRPAKILILGHASVTHTRRWIEYFQNRGWTVRALSFPPLPDAPRVEPLSFAGLPRALGIWLGRGRVRRVIDEFHPDITSALYLPDYGWLATLAGAQPLALSAWGSDVLVAPHKSVFHRRRIEKIVRRADHLFADASVVRDGLIGLGAPPDRISVVPLGVDDAFLKAGEKQPRDGIVPLVVVHNRRLEPVYRAETFVRAASRLQAERPGLFQFLVHGQGSERPRLERLASSLGLRDVLTFQGWLPPDQLPAALARCDIYASCASSDGTSVSLLEAMAAGCLPIVTDLPANREWINDGENGLLYPVDDDAALAKQIKRAAAPAFRATAIPRNRAIIRARARWQTNMHDVESQLMETIRRFRAR